MIGRPESEKGMTLVEVLVALTILAGVAGAVLLMTAQSARAAASVENKLLARIVADNAAVTALALNGSIQAGSNITELEFADQQWLVSQTFMPLEAGGLYQLQITVQLAGFDQMLARIDTLKAAS